MFLETSIPNSLAMQRGAAVTLAIRLAAIHWRLSLPNLARHAENLEI